MSTSLHRRERNTLKCVKLLRDVREYIVTALESICN
jgi:hypothetical protein